MSVVTYKRPNYLYWTLESFLAKNPKLMREAWICVLVQGLRPRDTAETEEVLLTLTKRWNVTLHCDFPNVNLGCGAGFTRINQIALSKCPGYVIHLQDDWQSEEPLEDYLEECFEAFEKVSDLGAIRLRSIQERVLDFNVITTRKIEYERVTHYVGVGNAHFTFNPTIIRADVLRRLLPVKFEFHAQKRYHGLGYRVGQLYAHCFVHIGDQRVPDWKR